MPVYSRTSKFLHHMALNYPALCELQFDVERQLKRGSLAPSKDGSHVFVCGLARAGTTVLMRSIYESREFSSLTYRDMPFVLAPNIWSTMQRGSQRSMEEEERAHGDGLLVDFDSPEALEEVFWRLFCGEDYLLDDRLVPHEVDDETTEKLRDYVSMITLRHERSRYLSKNNNNILRIGAIRTAFPDARVLIPFRDPVEQARSLLSQHQRFLEAHQTDAFTRKYMTWLAHHEFGSDHRPFHFVERSLSSNEPSNISYWLDRWNDSYSFLLDRYEDGNSSIKFVCYEDMCADDASTWRNLCDFLELPFTTPSAFRKKTASSDLKPINIDTNPYYETYERARSATTMTSSVLASRIVSPANRFLPASRKSFDQR